MNLDGSWRPCSDYWHLNLVTPKDLYALPNKADFADRLEGCVIFSKVDLRKGYTRSTCTPPTFLSHFITPFGLREFLRMMFGLRNAGNTF